ncbi:mechanosensitive ion channel family protein [Erysipelothrix urinaevulpis]|uniref:mechanosensitive ion channel family protein n=1 Tax=Erysipelothrix urinaevulpis TaxID=2683717 RepID=UPI001357221E|nr:mechanosensitive ion channel family protein [Erysipelothrix urinaevulpis]
MFEKIMLTEPAFGFIKKIGVSILIFVVASVVMNFIIKTLGKVLYSGEHNQKKMTLFTVLSSTVKYIIYFITVMIILELFGISTKSILAVASVGSVALGFGAQALVKDIISGLFILAENQFNVDDLIEVAEYTGVVEKMSLRTTILRTAKGEQCIIPNGEIRGVKNYSRDYINAIVQVPVPYDVNLNYLMKVMQDKLDRYFVDGNTISHPEVLGISEYGDSALLLGVVCKCHTGKNWAVERDLRRFILEILEEENIEVPFNTNTIHIESMPK